MGALHDRPTAAELVTAVREWLSGAVLAEGREAGSYDVRVAVAALDTVERELARGPAPDRFGELGFAGHDELAAAIRAGGVPPGQLPAVRAAVLADVEDALRVGNPRHLQQPQSTGAAAVGAEGIEPPTTRL